MREVEGPHQNWIGDLQPVEVEGIPYEEFLENQKVMITLLMRLYDLQLAQLSFINKEAADEVYDAHARGEHANPTIYIPVATESDET